MSSQTVNPFLLNIVPIFNVADPTNGIAANVVPEGLTNVQTMVAFSNHTVYTDNIEPFTANCNVQMIGDFSVEGTFTINGIPLGANDIGSNALVGSKINLEAGTSAVQLFSTSVSQISSPAIQFLVGNGSVFSLDSYGRGLYNGSAATAGQFWISSATTVADQISVGGPHAPSTIMDVWSGDAYFDHNIHVNSNIYCRAVYEFSDERLKSEIQPLSGALSTLMQLQGVHYTMDGQPQVGFLAQQVAPIVPEAVITSPSGHLAVDYTRIVPLLVEAVKELAAKL